MQFLLSPCFKHTVEILTKETFQVQCVRFVEWFPDVVFFDNDVIEGVVKRACIPFQMLLSACHASMAKRLKILG